jgi:hypothetical protein
MAEQIYYTSIAAAEKAIMDAGYMRDNYRHIWAKAEGKTAKVVRDDTRMEAGLDKFYVQWS